MIGFDNVEHQIFVDNGKSYRPGVERSIRLHVTQPSIIGIIVHTSPMLIDAWHACVSLGHTPIILHYPTPKLSRDYWKSEILHAIYSVNVDILLCENESCVPDGVGVPHVLLDTLPDESLEREPFVLPDDGAFLQLSSGTTGFRKGIKFEFLQVREHVLHYNKVLNIEEKDCIVSWLPLYHDMGFIATFLMPQILGCKLVLIDPIDWVRQPGRLWDAIEKHGGTICFMPNFGFEVMSANARRCPDSMRLWVSCSEPTRLETMRRFVESTSAPPDSIANCWGMAENIFAVCQSSGIKTRSIDRVEVVSCGRPIPGVEVKSVEGEIFVRSSYSLSRYVGVDIPLDEEGFYASGDVGEIHDGEVYLQGRRHDLIISAGRKYLLSDMDFLVGTLVPEAAGRIASFGVYEKELGTEILTILIEDKRFWERNSDGETIRHILSRIGMEAARISFVPPKFITKTSSGKINRKITRENWRKRSEAASDSGTTFHRDRALDEILAQFPWINQSIPLIDQVDSLGLVNLSLIMSKHGFEGALDRQSSIESILSAAKPGDLPDEVIKIVLLGDANPFRALASPAIERLLGSEQRPVQFKSVCVPPLPILLSDLAFLDYFACRLDEKDAQEQLKRVISDIRSASVLLVDDSTTLFWPQSESAMVYPRLSHDFQGNPTARHLGVRWAAYSESHHCFQLDLIAGVDMARERANDWIQDLSTYLKVPVVRIAYGADHPHITGEWEVQCSGSLRGVTAEWKLEGVDREDLERQLIAAIQTALDKAPRRSDHGQSFINYNDQPHWCSWLVNRDLIDFIVTHFNDIVVLGKRSSIPYLFEKAAEMGRRIRVRPDLKVPDDCDCVVQTGSWGRPETDKPLFQVMAAGWSGEPAVNLSPELGASCPPNRTGDPFEGVDRSADR